MEDALSETVRALAPAGGPPTRLEPIPQTIGSSSYLPEMVTSENPNQFHPFRGMARFDVESYQDRVSAACAPAG